MVKIKRQKKYQTKKNFQGHKDLFEEAFQQHQAGNLPLARQFYQQVLKDNPAHADALHLLGLIALQEGHFDRAIKLIKKALKQKKNQPDYLSNLGSAYRGCQSLQEAVTAFKQALHQQPDHVQSLFNLAQTLLELEQFPEAIQYFQRLLTRKSNMFEAHLGLGKALLGMGDGLAALTTMNAAIKLQPENPVGYYQLGLIYHFLKRFSDAENHLEKSTRLAPEMAEAHNALGHVLIEQNNFAGAIKAYQKALTAQPNFLAAQFNLSWALIQSGRIQEALEQYKKLAEKHPADPHCFSDYLFSLNYDPEISQKNYLEICHYHWQQFFTQQNIPESTFASAQQYKINTSPPLTLGFLSPDFRQHPVGTFIQPLINELSKRSLRICCYAEMGQGANDEITTAIQSMCDAWHVSQGVSDEKLAAQIKNDKVDILIDLAGHSAHNRLPVFCHRPASVQASWLGYVNSTGLNGVDYRFTDAIVDPPGAEAHYTEKLVRFPMGFFCYRPPESSPVVASLPAESSGQITFGSFNTPAKISEEVVERWAEILNQVPNAKLICMSRPFSDPAVVDYFLHLFEKHGASKKQIGMTGSLPIAEYLAYHKHIDIALDPWPHNGHTITCHTLWMGVPVISLRGNRYASRMGASILTRLQLEAQCLAETQAEYIEKAVSLANDLDSLKELRTDLRERIKKSELCDIPKFADYFEKVVRELCSKLN